MKGLAELVVSLCDLCEAEGRLLEAGVLRTVRRVGLLSLGLLFAGGALALLLAALYALLTALLPTPAALALLGLGSAGIAGLLLWNARGGAPSVAQAQRDDDAAAGPAGPPRGKAPATPAPATAREPGHGVWEGAAPYGRGAATTARPRRDASPEKPRVEAAQRPRHGENG